MNSQVPKHLKHKPIIAVDYDDDDAKFLSIGIAQWSENQESISAKVMRFNEETQRWSPQSEELPLYRVIDLAILISSIILNKNQYKSNLEKSPSMLKEECVDDENLKKLFKYLDEDKKTLYPKMRELKRILLQINL